jgi:hypothetical protein
MRLNFSQASKSSRPYLLAGLVGWRFRRRIAGSMAKIANNKVHSVACYDTIAPIVGMYKKKFVSAFFCSIIKGYLRESR